ncbi:MAG: hypothetical protein ACD_41C00064G0005 [uncultured bacterium]|nr:MAG: hypothetical protein ACD_41C00064G0005 [uncultured bacterium]HBY73725.1 16S rRNA (cytosine(1402)-N(4))-methyltransferase [Candidatus Kerfeldbacteria bacterium]
MPTDHVPVLAHEVIELLSPKPGDTVVDGTLGGGGHARLLHDCIQPGGQVYALEHDPAAIAALGSTPFIVKQANFATLQQVCADWNISGQVNGILLDLGYSSDQLKRGRGLSFRALTEPLDLRLDPTLPQTAADLLNDGTSTMLVEMFRNYGELKQPQRLARVIIDWRLDHSITTVADLVECVQQAYHTSSSDVLAKVWQACRIAVNNELAVLEQGLQAAFTVLSPGGRLAVITFHSLEDRIVKHQFAAWADTKCICPPEVPVCTCQRTPLVRLLTKHPVVPTAAEINRNPRSRSAKLRAIEKL